VKRVLAKLRKLPAAVKVGLALAAVVALVVVGWWAWGLPGTIAGLLLSALGLTRAKPDGLGGHTAVDYAAREAERAATDAAAARVAGERAAQARLDEAQRLAREAASADAARLSDRDVLDLLTDNGKGGRRDSTR